MKAKCKGRLAEIIPLRLFRGATYIGKLAKSVNHTQISIARVSAQLQWSAVPVHPAFTWPVLRYTTLQISPSEISWGVIYVDIGGWCHTSLPRPVLRRPVTECTTDSAALTTLVQKLQFCSFRHPEERISSACLDICSHRSRKEQRKQIVSHHTLIFSAVIIVLCIPRGLQLCNAVLLFHPPCTLSKEWS